MERTLRMAHLAVGAIAVAAFLVTGLIMHAHEPALSTMDWGERLLFRSRYVYILCAGLANLALGLNYLLPSGRLRRACAGTGSLLALVSAILLFFAFFAEPMAGRPPGPLSALGLHALFAGVLLCAGAGLGLRRAAR